MLFLDRKDLADAFTLPMVISAVERAFQDYHKGALRVPGRLTTEDIGPKGSSLVLPSLHTIQPFYGLKQASLQAAGDLIVPKDAGLIDMNVIHGELGALLASELSGRETSDEITMYESVGFGALDLSVAMGAYRACKAAGVGLKIDS